MKSHQAFLFTLLFVVLLSLGQCLPTSVHQEVEEDFAPEMTTEASEPVQIFTSAPGFGESFKINCAGDTVGDFKADRYQFSEGPTSSFSVSTSTVLGSEEVPAGVFISHRYGLNKLPWAYVFPMQSPGTYSCTLYFGEIFEDYMMIGGRVFSVSAKGNADTQTSADIDIYAETGGDATAYITREFILSVTDTITFDFESTAAEAMVSAISCQMVS